MKRGMNDEKTANKKCLIGFYVLCFFLIYIMSSNYPVHTDEYIYSYIFGTNIKITVPIQLLISLKKMYFEWSGRIVSNFLQQLFIYLGTSFFIISNSMVFILILWYSYKIISNILKIEKTENNMLKINILLFFFIWFFIPAFSQDFIWMVGSANYAWPLFLNLIFLDKLMRLNEEEKIKIKYIILIFIVAVSNESSVIFTGILMLIFLFFEFIKNKKFKKNKLEIFIYFSLCSLAQILAPGNLLRIKNESQVFFPRNTILEKMFYILNLMEFQILIVLSIVLVIILYILKIRIKRMSVVLLITSILNLVVFIFMLPRNENRALLYPLFGLILFITILIYQVSNKLNNRNQWIMIFGLLLISSNSLLKIFNYYDVDLRNLENKRKFQLNYYSSTNNKEVVLEKYGSKVDNVSKQHKGYDFLQTNPNSFSNVHMATFYGFDKLYAVNEGSKLLIVQFSNGSNIEMLRIDTDKNVSIFNFKQSYLSEKNELFLEIPSNSKVINISGENFMINKIKIIKVLEGIEYENNSEVKNIEIKI